MHSGSTAHSPAAEPRWACFSEASRSSQPGCSALSSGSRTLGFSAIRSGLAFLPWLAAFTTMAQVGTRVIAKRVGPRWTIAPGVAIVGIALVMPSRLGVSSNYAADVLPWLILFGAGSTWSASKPTGALGPA